MRKHITIVALVGVIFWLLSEQTRLRKAYATAQSKASQWDAYERYTAARSAELEADFAKLAPERQRELDNWLTLYLAEQEALDSSEN